MEANPKMPQKACKLYFAETRFLFNAHIKIKIPMDFGKSMINSCFEVLEKVDKKYNSYTEGSVFDTINKNAGEWVPVDVDTAYMIEEILKMRTLTNGIYDIGVMPLLKLWGFYRSETKEAPSPGEIEQTLQKVKDNRMELENHRVRISKDAEITTGSFMKAFAVDKAIAFLKSEGLTDAVINAGGSTIYALNDDTHPSWTVNIPNPKKKDSYCKAINLQNSCLSLSARAQHFIEINGKEYSHVLNAQTGYPSTHLQSAVITKSAFIGDMLSTAIMANDSDESMDNRLKEAFPGSLSYYVVKNGDTSGAPQFINC